MFCMFMDFYFPAPVNQYRTIVLVNQYRTIVLLLSVEVLQKSGVLIQLHTPGDRSAHLPNGPRSKVGAVRYEAKCVEKL